MAVILILDRVKARGFRLPHIKAVVCDGYTLYTEEKGEEETRCAIRGGKEGVSVLGMARTLMGSSMGQPLYHEMREELARLAAEERAARRERQTAKEAKGTDA